MAPKGINRVMTEIYGTLHGEARESFRRGCIELGYDDPAGEAQVQALKESFKRANPSWTAEQLEIAARGR